MFIFLTICTYFCRFTLYIAWNSLFRELLTLRWENGEPRSVKQDTKVNIAWVTLSARLPTTCIICQHLLESSWTTGNRWLRLRFWTVLVSSRYQNGPFVCSHDRSEWLIYEGDICTMATPTLQIHIQPSKKYGSQLLSGFCGSRSYKQIYNKWVDFSNGLHSYPPLIYGSRDSFVSSIWYLNKP